MPADPTVAELLVRVRECTARRRHVVDLRNDADGELDDVVVRDVEWVHLERMDEGAWWLGVYLRGKRDRLVIWLAADRPARTKVRATATEVPDAGR